MIDLLILVFYVIPVIFCCDLVYVGVKIKAFSVAESYSYLFLALIPIWNIFLTVYSIVCICTNKTSKMIYKVYSNFGFLL